jgi:hypothetical protein
MIVELILIGLLVIRTRILSLSIETNQGEFQLAATLFKGKPSQMAFFLRIQTSTPQPACDSQAQA